MPFSFFRRSGTRGFGDVDEGLGRLQMDGADLAFRDGGDAGDDADEIARLHGVGAADVEGESDHAGLMAKRRRLLRAGRGRGARASFAFVSRRGCARAARARAGSRRARVAALRARTSRGDLPGSARRRGALSSPNKWIRAEAMSVGE